MFTIIGKAFVFVIVCVSLVALGISVWAIVDKHDWHADRKKIVEEIVVRQTAREHQRSALILLLDEIGKGDRTMPWDPETGAKPESVAKTKQQIKEIAKEIDTLFAKETDLVVAQRGLVDDLAKAREEYSKGLAEHKALREEIKPEDPNKKGFRALALDHRTAKETAEADLEKLRPAVFNELVRVAQVKARLDELTARLKELQGASGSAAK